MYYENGRLRLQAAVSFAHPVKNIVTAVLVLLTTCSTQGEFRKRTNAVASSNRAREPHLKHAAPVTNSVTSRHVRVK
jgi:hypothetical protein